MNPSFFSYNIFSQPLHSIPFPTGRDEQILISTLNPHSFFVADHDKEFKLALNQSQILLPDGIGIVYANWLINGSIITKISGMDVFLFLLKKLNDSPDLSMKRIFFLGASEQILKSIHDRIQNEFPSLVMGYYSPPFKASFSADECQLMITAINDFEAYVLFVGMTAPKQEKWVLMHHHLIKAKILCSIGAVFDFYSGNIKRPGRAWQMLGLEWFGRFIREPRRLYKRYLISLPYFIAEVFKEAFRKRFSR